MVVQVHPARQALYRLAAVAAGGALLAPMHRARRRAQQIMVVLLVAAALLAVRPRRHSSVVLVVVAVRTATRLDQLVATQQVAVAVVEQAAEKEMLCTAPVVQVVSHAIEQ